MASCHPVRQPHIHATHTSYPHRHQSKKYRSSLHIARSVLPSFPIFSVISLPVIL
ncbi:hypothetical protein BDR03DRAFT_947124 [Suillus americanus]|nr:hypothetical protein BDR03DRAFT_947124 [Suillus americanus]